jgi:hypothetical protein
VRFFRERKISRISKNPQKCSVFNETQDLSFFCRGDFNRGVVLPIFTFVCLLSWPQALFGKVQLASVFSLLFSFRNDRALIFQLFPGHFQLDQAICGPKLTEIGVLGAI